MEDAKQLMLYRLCFWAILVAALFLRVIPAWDNNFYFTMDAGNDAVHVRELLVRHQFPLMGPETGLNGVYAGPGWFYFIAVGLALFGGHPFGAVFMMILLNLFVTAVLMRRIKQEVSPLAALTAGAGLQVFWPFYDASRYGFNPFPLVFFAFALVLFLTDVLRGKPTRYVLAALLVGSGFHAEVAGATAIALFYVATGVWSVYKKLLSPGLFAAGVLIVGLFFLPHAVSELQTNFSQTRSILNELSNPRGMFFGQPPQAVVAGDTSIRGLSLPLLEAAVFLFGVIVWFVASRSGKKNKRAPFVKRFLTLTLVLVGVTWVWFAASAVWRPWQTGYVGPLLFVAVLLSFFDIPKTIGYPALVVFLAFHAVTFGTKYQKFFRPTADPSLLRNELAAVDWVYRQAGGRGFSVYSYLPSVYDYPYQYLFWWHGRKTYGYVPCAYGTYPGAPGLFVPGRKYYQDPVRDCPLPASGQALRFLIIEPDSRADNQRRWLEGARTDTKLLEVSTAGSIQMEKRVVL